MKRSLEVLYLDTSNLEISAALCQSCSLRKADTASVKTAPDYADVPFCT